MKNLRAKRLGKERYVLGFFGVMAFATLTAFSSRAYPGRKAPRTLPTRRVNMAAATRRDLLEGTKLPDKWPYREADFRRMDESSDTQFYSAPRFVYHIDDQAVAALTKYYSETFPPKADILDICSSWVSHFPESYEGGRISGSGMNEAELRKNERLSDYSVRDLNVDPKLPYEDNSFDVVTNVVSVDYLSKPLDVFKEVRRVLRPGGLAIMSFSNRCFPTKAINIWLSTGDIQHVYIVGTYFHFAGGFDRPQGFDISPNPGRSDPMFIVQARKANTA